MPPCRGGGRPGRRLHREGRPQRVPRARALVTRELPPADALQALERSWCEYVPEIMPVALELEPALIAGDDDAVAWRDRMGELHQAFRFAARRLEAACELAKGWTADAAGDWAWAQVRPSNRLHLVGERGWTEDECLRRTVASIVGELVAGRSPAAVNV